MVGISGAGKSTWAKKLFPQHVSISLDKIQNHNRGIENVMIKDHLKQQHNIVIDDTNLTRDIRSKHIILAKKYDAKITAVFIDTSMSKILINNKNREDPRPEPALFHMQKQLEEPCKDEGFDFIQIVKY